MTSAVHTLMETIEEHDPELSEAERNRFRNIPSLKQAIKVAAESRKENGHPYGHQQRNWNFWPDAIPKATKILLDAHDKIEACSDLDEIHDLIKALLSDVKGLKELYCYDVAERIGAYRDCLPEKVYLHAGPLKAAKRLNLDWKKGYLEIWELPECLRTYQPCVIEDILCHYSRYC